MKHVMHTCCQFILGRDHTAHGRARHPFMTGSSGWAYNAATRYMPDIRPGFDRLTVVPAQWDGVKVQRIWRGTVYRIRVENPEHVRKGIKAIFADGQQVESVRVFSSGTHDIRVIIG